MNFKTKSLARVVLLSCLVVSLSFVATTIAAEKYDLYLPAVTNGDTKDLSAPVLWAIDYPYCDIGPTGGDAAAAAAVACVLAAAWAILNGVPIGISPTSSGGGGTGGDLAKTSSYDFSKIPPPEDPTHGIMIACDGDGPLDVILAAFIKGREIKVTPGSGSNMPVVFGSGGRLGPGLTLKSGEDETKQLAEKRELWGQVKMDIIAEFGFELLQFIRRLDKSKTLLFSRQEVCDVSGVAEALLDRNAPDPITAAKWLRVYRSDEVRLKAMSEFQDTYKRKPDTDNSHDILKLDNIYNRLKEKGK